MTDAQSLIRRDLPNFPEQVVVEWLGEYSENPGWPPKADYLEDPSSRWNRLLRHKSLVWWQNVKWQRIRLKPERLPFNEDSYRSILGVGKAFLSPIPTEYSFIGDLKPRCASILQYMDEHGVFPVPVILICENGIYDIADGSHRLAIHALMTSEPALKTKLASEQPFWIAYPPES